MGELTLILGGARSGKSAFAERLAAAAGPRVLYVATAVAGDAEMEARIRRHRQRRPPAWTTLEEPSNPAAALEKLHETWDCVLIDSVAFWLSNSLLAALDPSGGFAPESAHRLEREALAALQRLLDWRAKGGCDLVAVSDEAGMGVVPAFAAGRAYRNLLGTVNQALAAASDRVALVIAGLPIALKGTAFREDPAPARASHDPD